MAFEQPVLERASEAELASFDEIMPRNDVIPQAFRRRSDIAPSDLRREVNTLGWDTTYVLRVADVNKVLEKSNDYPRSFHQALGDDIKVEGAWGPWRIAQGGSGSIIFFAVPIIKGTMTFGSTKVDMSDSTAYISLKLKYVPQKPGKVPAKAALSAASRTPNNLERIDDLISDAEDRSEADPAVVIQKLVFKGKPPSSMNLVLMTGALQEWFNANLAQFTYVFAAISINERAAEQAFQWLKPTYTGYGYQDGADDESSFFGILSMTDDRSPASLSNVIAPNSVPAGSRAGFNISLSRYMEKIVFPSLVKGFPHATPSSFTMNDSNTMIMNKPGIRIRCDDVKVGLVNYTPYIHDFVLQVVGDEIQIYTKTVTQVSPGIRSVVTNTSYQTIKLVTKPDKTQTLDFAETRPPLTNSYVDKDTWVVVTEIILSVASAIALAVGGVVIKGAVKIIVASIIIAIVAGLLAATPQLIAIVIGGGAADALPSIDLLILNSTAPTQWPGAKDVFKLDNVFLNGALQLGGDPQISA